MWKNLFQITFARVIISFLLLSFVVFVGKLLTTPRKIIEVTIELDGIKSSCPAWVTFYGTTANRKEMAFAIFSPLLKHNPDLCLKLPQAVGKRVTVSFKKNVVNTVDGEISVNEVTGLRFILPESPAPKAPVQRHLPVSAASALHGRSGFSFVKQTHLGKENLVKKINEKEKTQVVLHLIHSFVQKKFVHNYIPAYSK